jgi:hypothetical protein
VSLAGGATRTHETVYDFVAGGPGGDQKVLSLEADLQAAVEQTRGFAPLDNKDAVVAAALSHLAAVGGAACAFAGSAVLMEFTPQSTAHNARALRPFGAPSRRQLRELNVVLQLGEAVRAHVPRAPRRRRHAS